MKKENWINGIIGFGASVVIIGAWLKITYISFGPINGYLMLNIGLVTEEIIFAIVGYQGLTEKIADKPGDGDDEGGINTIKVETLKLQKAVDGFANGLNDLNSNILQASKATASISVPSDLEKNSKALSDGLSTASGNIDDVNKLYSELNETLKKVNSATTALDMPDGIGEELQKMKSTIKELNAKYEAMLGAMNK